MSGLYLVLVVIICASLYSCIRIIRMSVHFVNSGKLGYEIRDFAKENPSISDKILIGKDGEVKKNIECFLIVAVIVSYVLLYLVNVS